MQGHDGSTVVTLYQPDRLQVRVDVRFSDLPQVAVGQTVQINNPVLAKPLLGRVLLISSIADIQKNTLEVKVVIDEPPSLFKPEMLVYITFLSTASSTGGSSGVDQPRNFVPRALVRSDAEGNYVWLADQASGRVRRVGVTMGVGAPGGLVEVTGNLSMGSRVVAGGGDGLVDGQRIRVAGEEPEAAYSDGEGFGSSGVGQKTHGTAADGNHNSGESGKSKGH